MQVNLGVLLVRLFKGIIDGKDRSGMRWAHIFLFFQLTFPENKVAAGVCASGLSCEVQEEKELVWKSFLKPKGIRFLYK